MIGVKIITDIAIEENLESNIENTLTIALSKRDNLLVVYTIIDSIGVTIEYVLEENAKVTLKQILSHTFQHLKIRKIKIRSGFTLNLLLNNGYITLGSLNDIKRLLKYWQINKMDKQIFTSSSIPYSVRDKYNNNIKCNLNIRDLQALKPNKKELSDLAESLKINISKYNNSNFESMVIYKWIVSIFKEEIPISIASTAEEYFKKKLLEENNWTEEDLLREYCGKELVSSGYKKKKESLITSKYLVSAESIFKEAFYGGMNQVYRPGIYYGNVYDYDMRSAFPTAASAINDIVLTDELPIRLENLDNLDLIKPGTVGAGLVKFNFPEQIKFPCIPVRDEYSNRGIIFPRTGVSYTANATLWLAVKMGADIELIDYVVLHQDSTKNTYRSILKEAVEERSRYDKKTPMEQLIKERNNSILGKIQQGITAERKTNIKSTGRSSITNTFLSVAFLDLIKALLCGVQEEIEKRGYKVWQTITDGFTSNIPPEELNKIKIDGLTDLYEETLEVTTGDSSIFDLKHFSDYLYFNVKTRCHYGVSHPFSRSGYDGVFTNGNYKMNRSMRETMDDKDKKTMIKKILDRRKEPVFYDVTVYPKFKDFISINNIEMEPERIQRSTNWEYDFKRQPINPVDKKVTIDGEEYLVPTFDTKPWDSIDDFMICRDFIDEEKMIFDKSDIYKNIKLLKALRQAQIQLNDSIEKIKSAQIIRLEADGKIESTLERSLIEALEEFYGVEIKDNFYYNNRSRGRKEKTIDPMFLEEDLKDLGIKIL